MLFTQSSVLTVSQLNRRIRLLLEDDVGEVSVVGEISNCARPSSGHLYFTLKDAGAQLKAVFFKNRHGLMAKTLKDGQLVEVSGRLSLYEARGDYQLIVEKMSDAGVGDLHRQFELLKEKLAAQGLFDSIRKKPLPKFPQTIGVISSPTGAAIRDILTTLANRYPLAEVIVYSADVQGRQAAPKLIQALNMAQIDARADVLILARGGGSLEDLWAFNDENLALAIANCSIPIISGVGHETDFTIADFVADFRAATPTAAAQAATPDKLDLLKFTDAMIYRLHHACARYYQRQNTALDHILKRLSSPATLIARYWQTLDYLEHRLHNAVSKVLQSRMHDLALLTQQLESSHPRRLVDEARHRFQILESHLYHRIMRIKEIHDARLNSALAALHLVSPLATLARGYAIASQQGQVLYTSSDVSLGDKIDIRLSSGGLTCQVIERHEEEVNA